MSKSKISLFLLAIFVTFALWAQRRGEVRTLKIAVAVPLSVEYLQPEPQFICDGVELAVEEANRRSSNYFFIVQAVDDKADKRTALNVAKKLGRNREIIGVVGHFNSSATLTAAIMYNRYRLVAISPASTSPRISQAGRYIFRVVPSDADQGRKLAEYARRGLGVSRAVVIYDNDDYGRGLSYFFCREFRTMRGEIVAKIAFIKGVTNLYAALKAIKRKNPDLLFVAGVPYTCAHAFRVADSIGLRVKKMGGDGCMPQSFREMAGRHAEGVYHSMFVDTRTSRYRDFVRRFKAKFRKSPSIWAAFAYDAANLIIKAVQERGASRENVRRYLIAIGRSVPVYKGVTGEIQFNAHGDLERDILIARVVNGKPKIIFE